MPQQFTVEQWSYGTIYISEPLVLPLVLDHVPLRMPLLIGRKSSLLLADPENMCEPWSDNWSMEATNKNRQKLNSIRSVPVFVSQLSCSTDKHNALLLRYPWKDCRHQSFVVFLLSFVEAPLLGTIIKLGMRPVLLPSNFIFTKFIWHTHTFQKSHQKRQWLNRGVSRVDNIALTTKLVTRVTLYAVIFFHGFHAIPSSDEQVMTASCVKSLSSPIC